MKIRFSPGLYLVSQHLITINGVYYYNRKYPDDLRSRFGGKVRKKVSLRTRDPLAAARKASKMAAEDDAMWEAMRGNPSLPVPEVRRAANALIDEYAPTEWKEPHPYRPGEFAIWPKPQVLTELLEADDSPLLGTEVHLEATRVLAGVKRVPLLSEALEVYLKEHKKRGNKHFEKVTRYGLGLVFSRLGDRPMDAYTRPEIYEWRDTLQRTTATKTLRRRIDSICAVFNKACSEFQLSLENPFANLTIHGEGLDSKARDTYTASELALLKSAVEAKSDDMRWIIGLQIETGARLGEIVGLRAEDVVLSHPVPHIKIRTNLHLGRTLKNKQSERDVPLVGVSLWSAKCALKASPRGWLFPRYASDGNIKATHASNSLVKWIKKTVGRNGSIGNHSFRHTLLDRLRDSGCPLDAAQQIVGHGAMTITRGYGKGYSLEKLRGYLEGAKLPDNLIAG